MEIYHNIFLLPFNEAVIALEAAELEDKYIYCCNRSPLNRTARASCIYKPWAMSAAEFANKGAAFKQLFIELSNRAPILPTGRVNIIIMEPSADDGLPHTRAPNIICLPYNALKSAALLSTLFHELVHIFQRENPVMVDALYKNVWRCMKAGSVANIGERINPDGMELYYYMMRNDWFVRNHFLREDKPQLANVRPRFYNIQTGASTTIVPKEFTDFFGKYARGSALEHPHEIMAYMWTDIVFDITLYKTPAQYGLEAWIDKIGKNK